MRGSIVALFSLYFVPSSGKFSLFKIAWNRLIVSGIGCAPSSSASMRAQSWYWRNASLRRPLAAYARISCRCATSSQRFSFQPAFWQGSLSSYCSTLLTGVSDLACGLKFCRYIAPAVTYRSSWPTCHHAPGRYRCTQPKATSRPGGSRQQNHRSRSCPVRKAGRCSHSMYPARGGIQTVHYTARLDSMHSCGRTHVGRAWSADQKTWMGSTEQVGSLPQSVPARSACPDRLLVACL